MHEESCFCGKVKIQNTMIYALFVYKVKRRSQKTAAKEIKNNVRREK